MQCCGGSNRRDRGGIAAKATTRVGVLLASRRGTAWLSQVTADLEIVGTPGLVDATTIGPALAGCEVIVADSHLPAPLAEVIQVQGVPRESPIDSTLPDAWNGPRRVFPKAKIVDTHQLEPLYPRMPPRLWRLFEAR